MNRIFATITTAVALALTAGCGQDRTGTEPAAQAQPPAPEPYVVEYRAVGKTFQGPSEIRSGWVTFRFVNASPMIHFAMLDVPPEGIGIVDMDPVMIAFQEAMDAMNAGDEEGVNAAFGRFPPWIGKLGRAGGPGFLSAGRTGETTVYLEPGQYILECYVKSDGVFHTTPPGDGQRGMVLPITVIEEPGGAPEPAANMTLVVTNGGFDIADGAPRSGHNTIRVDFLEQQALPSFVGNDVHLIRIDSADAIAAADAWMDWRTPNGLEDPAPVEFLGGVNDMPAGSLGYFTVDLEPGDYAFIAEVPGPEAAGFVLPFSVASESE